MPKPEEFHATAIEQFERDELVVQRFESPGQPKLEQIVDQVDGGAWVMAWVFVEDGEV